jgi:parallel beta helix pectate lyase-like protein
MPREAVTGERGVLRRPGCVMADLNYDDPEPRWFGLKRRPRAKTILLAFLVVDVVVAGSLIAANMASGANQAAAGPVAQVQVKAGTGPSSPPARICGNASVLGAGPSSAPAGAVTVPAGRNAGIDFSRPHATYWFAPGVHTLASGQYTQIIPGHGSKYVGAPGAILDGRKDNLYAFGGNATGVTISYLTVRNFGGQGENQDQGVVNENSMPGWTIDHSTIKDNAGAGVMLGSHNTLIHDCLADNQQYGFNAYSPSGPVGLVLKNNEIAGNDTYNWEAHSPDCGCTGGGKFWDVKNAVIENNWIHDNHSVGLWADTNNRGFEFKNNYISGNYDYGLIYEISYNAVIEQNTFARNGIHNGPKGRGFPTSAIYISESGSDHRVKGSFNKTFLIARNSFIDNWGGVILWENADRFCNSPANTSSGTCTLVDPSVATIKSCNAVNIKQQPYLGDCRWKTQNVQVQDNMFSFKPSDIGPSCTPANECGFQGVFSEYGTYPNWSPYHKTVVEQQITYSQNNHFRANTYIGPWIFMIYEQGNVVNWPQWQGKPYAQDKGSTLNTANG